MRGSILVLSPMERRTVLVQSLGKILPSSKAGNLDERAMVGLSSIRLLLDEKGRHKVDGLVGVIDALPKQ